jgi:hypothetical protein
MASLKHAFHLVTYSLRAVGPAAILKGSLRWGTDPDARSVDSGFDARYGTDTNAALTPVEAGIPAGRRAGATMYLPSMDQDLDAMLAAVPWPSDRTRHAAFVDVGSGKGRVVLLAAMRRFREVIGVELSPVLHAIAECNLARVRDGGHLASPASVELGDATELALPDGPVVLFLYHPFREAIALAVMDRVLASLAADPRPIAILYGHPTLQRPMDPTVFTRGSVFREVAAGERRTRKFQIGWTVLTNDAWLAASATSPRR